MAVEVERKFRVASDDWRVAVEASTAYRQGYLCAGAPATVRVRIANGSAWLTIKGPTHGVSRAEFEYPIPTDDAQALLADLCQGPLVEKTRHIVTYAGLRWEIDEFDGDNAGLIVAEVELDSPDVEVPLPPWIGVEVSDQPRFYNSALADRPFSCWTAEERGPLRP